MVLNWNGWRDTIRCLASLAGLNQGNHAIYVVDNASTDGSESHLRAWRTALWEIKQALLLTQPAGRNSLRHRMLLLVAAVLGPACYCLGRLGDCPTLVRWVQRRYVAASNTSISG